MINKAKNITKKEAVKMFRLYRKMVKADVRSRLPSTAFPSYADWAMMRVELDTELREFLFGTSNLFELAEKWGMIKPTSKSEERRQKKKRKKK